MNKDLSGFVAEGIEFIIGGTVFLASVVLLLFALGSFPTDSEFRLADELGTAGVTFLFIACTYAAGVLIEGASRLIFERVLDYMTLRVDAFWKKAEAEGEPVETPTGDRDRTRWFLGSGPVNGTLRNFTAKDLAACVAVREQQRVYVMGAYPNLSAEIGAQLKRLRLERIAFASGLVAFAAFLISHAWWAALAWLGVLCVLGILVYQRLQRYCATIARTFAAAEAMSPDNDDAQGEATQQQAPR